MIGARLCKIVALVLGAWMFVPSTLPRVRAKNVPLVVVIGAQTSVRDIALATLRRAFLGEAMDMGGGKRFIPLNHPPGSPLRVAFDLKVLGLTPDQMGAFWVDRRIRAETAPPRMVPDVDLAVRVVGTLAGAITYVTPDLVTPRVRVLTIEGKAPGQPGYVLGP